MSDFNSFREKIFRERLSASIIWMAVPLYLCFSIIDFISARPFWLEFVIIRLITSAFLGLVAYRLNKSDEVKYTYIELAAHLCTGALGIGIGYMTIRTGGLGSPYYAGLNWIAIGSLAFWPWRKLGLVISILTIYVPLVFFYLISDAPSEGKQFLLPLVFMIGTIFLSYINNLLIFHSHRREFQLRDELEHLITNKDSIIETKSAEAIQLKRMAKQFSPAVIRGIESQAISLDNRKRQKVAIVFIDVVGSTSQQNLIDHIDFQKALDLFFTTAIRKFLDNNITVSNFMGDGLMAIANAPFEIPDFEKVALRTAVDIIRDTKIRQRALKEFWHKEFNVRAGVGSGYATVGFFPNTDFGLYSAVGETVNLASRLCSAAEPNSVAASKSMIVAAGADLGDSTVKVAGSTSDLKGFSGDHRDYYSVKPAISIERDVFSSACPLCRSPLGEASDLGDCTLVKCTKCQYSDIQNKVLRTDAA